MAIPGRTLDKVETRAKVKIGVKSEPSKPGGRSFPKSVDWFVCDDAEFQTKYAGKPKKLLVTLPFATPDENFGTGLERWLSKKDKSGEVLTCYSKDGAANPIALRLTDFVLPSDEIRGEARGTRTPVTCRADDCPLWKDRTCKPMGRLQFFLLEGRQDEALQLDTKSWNTIEAITPELNAAYRRSPDLRGRTFALTVAYVSKGQNRYPVVSIKEVGVPISTEADIDLADAFVTAQKVLERKEEAQYRVALASLLDLTRPDWKDEPELIARIKEIGVEQALTGTLYSVEKRLA